MKSDWSVVTQIQGLLAQCKRVTTEVDGMEKYNDEDDIVCGIILSSSPGNSAVQRQSRKYNKKNIIYNTWITLLMGNNSKLIRRSPTKSVQHVEVDEHDDVGDAGEMEMCVKWQTFKCSSLMSCGKNQ